jgi:NAD(P)-dependent dehydrogenase (short-subunit alcohol dehydrogenase family)
MATLRLTGATDGIGRATARLLQKAGHRVLVHAGSEERGQPVVEALSADPGSTGKAVLVTGDLARLDEVRGLAEQVRALGPLDALVHNAGVWMRGDTPRTTVDGFETTFAVNVLAPHLLTSLLADQLRDRVVGLGSGMAGSGRPVLARERDHPAPRSAPRRRALHTDRRGMRSTGPRVVKAPHLRARSFH